MPGRRTVKIPRPWVPSKIGPDGSGGRGAMVRMLIGKQARWVVDDDGIAFVDYPFFPASVFPVGRVDAGSIDDIDLSLGGPMVRIGGELLWVSRRHEDALVQLIARRGIPEVQRHDLIWGGLLEPALDTEFDDEWQQHTYASLEVRGLDRAAVDALRARFVPPVLRYNRKLWEWLHLGLFDLLFAVHPGFWRPLAEGVTVTPLWRNAWPPLRSTRSTYPELYREAMRLALLEPGTPPG